MSKVLDWRAVLTEHRVPFIERGPNVKRGEINVQCPFCGTADPSQHMGLNLKTGYWCCWRNKSAHKGKSPLRLLVALLRISYWEALEIAGLTDDSSYKDPDGYDAVAARYMQRTGAYRPEQVQRRHLKFGKELIAFAESKASARRFETYLWDQRGFDPDHIDELVDQYNLRYAITGDFKDRIILPYYMDEVLVAWTGRAIADSSIRYRDLPIDECVVPPKETLFNHDCILDGGEILVVQEGPFDALKVDFYGQPEVRSVALSTNSITEQQVSLLQAASRQFRRIVVVMDMATQLGAVDSMKLRQQLSFLPNVTTAKVPFGAKDGGDLTPREVHQWATELQRT